MFYEKYNRTEKVYNVNDNNLSLGLYIEFLTHKDTIANKQNNTIAIKRV